MSIAPITTKTTVETLEFTLLRRSSAFYTDIKAAFKEVHEPLYADQASSFSKIADRDDRRGEILLSNRIPVGFLAYKDDLQGLDRPIGLNRSFEVIACFLTNPVKDKDKKYDIKLLERIHILAEEKRASYIHMIISSRAIQSIAFFISQGFQIRKISREEDLLFFERRGTSATAPIDTGPAAKAPIYTGSAASEEIGIPRLTNKRNRAAIEAPAVSEKPYAPEPPSVRAELSRERIEVRSVGIPRFISTPLTAQFERPSRTHSFPLKKQYLDLIKSGRKTVEGRIATTTFLSIHAGDSIEFFSNTDRVLCKVSGVGRYPSFREMLSKVGTENCLPGTRSLEEGVRIYDSIPSYAEKSARFGVLALHITKI